MVPRASLPKSDASGRHRHDPGLPLGRQLGADVEGEVDGRVEGDLIERTVPAGAFVCRKGEPIEHWFGVIDGLLHQRREVTAPPHQHQATGVGHFVHIEAPAWTAELVLDHLGRPGMR